MVWFTGSESECYEKDSFRKGGGVVFNGVSSKTLVSERLKKMNFPSSKYTTKMVFLPRLFVSNGKWT